MPSRHCRRSRRTTGSMSSGCWSKPGLTECRRARSPRALSLAPNTLTFHFDRLRARGACDCAARRPVHDLRRALRGDERADRLSDRQLLWRRAGKMPAGATCSREAADQPQEGRCIVSSPRPDAAPETAANCGKCLRVCARRAAGPRGRSNRVLLRADKESALLRALEALLEDHQTGASMPWIAPSTCSFSAPAIPRARSWRRRS